MTPDEALLLIKKLADEGRVRYASDKLCSQLDDEIQEIYAAVRLDERGKPPARDLWTSDGQTIRGVLDRGTDEEALFKKVSDRLGIVVKPTDLWEEAALRLRDYKNVVTKS